MMKIRRIPYQTPVIIVCLGNIGLRLPPFCGLYACPLTIFSQGFNGVSPWFTLFTSYVITQYPLPQQLGHSIPVATTTGSIVITSLFAYFYPLSAATGFFINTFTHVLWPVVNNNWASCHYFLMCTFDTPIQSLIPVADNNWVHRCLCLIYFTYQWIHQYYQQFIVSHGITTHSIEEPLVIARSKTACLANVSAWVLASHDVAAV